MEKNLVPGNRYFLYVVQPTYRPLTNPFCYPMRADFVKLETVGGEYRYLLHICTIKSPILGRFISANATVPCAF
jgi:hypothetical protein